MVPNLKKIYDCNTKPLPSNNPREDLYVM